MLCLPWDSFLVSNDRRKIEQLFESRQDGAVEKPRLWRKILHVQRVNNGSLDGRSGAIGDPHHPEGAPVGELTGIRHILPQDGSQFLARDFASLRRCAMRSRIATHSQEVRSLRSYVGPARAVMAAAAEVVVTAQSNEKPDFDKQPERILLRVTLR